jgi:hypothetical protein
MANSLQPYWFTSANLHYLDRAAVLAESMSQFHPDWESVLILVDNKPTNNDNFKKLTQHFDIIITPEEISTLDPKNWFNSVGITPAFQNIGDWFSTLSVVEACTAIKPFVFEELAKMRRPIIYLDPDIAVFASMEEVLAELTNGASIAVTPHQLVPSSDYQAIIDNEVATLKYGIFNFGFLAIDPKKQNALDFIDFWRERLKLFCSENTDKHTFTDQKWGNFLPTFYDDLAIIRHPGMNVANWNLDNRNVTFNLVGDCLVNGEPLVFYHFSKAKDFGQAMTSRYASENTAVAGLWRWYLGQLNANAALVTPVRWKYKS